MIQNINNCINRVILQIIFISGILAQTGHEPFSDKKSDKTYYIQSVSEAPKIDGILNEPFGHH